MMNGNGQGQSKGKEPVERVLDLFVHTPIGLAVMAWKRVPELVTSMPDLVGQAVTKGCATLSEAEERLSQEVRKARMIGQVAVTFGGRQLRREVDARLRDARQAAEGVASFVPGRGAPGGSNGAGGGGAGSGGGEKVSPVTATATPTAPASPPAAAEPAASRKTAASAKAAAPAKTGVPRKSPAKSAAPGKSVTKAPGKTPAKQARKAPAPAAIPAATPAAAPAAAPAASAADLPIREYDGLSASQVVSRLTGLTGEELRAVRSYEESSRGRRTVILAIDRLLT